MDFQLNEDQLAEIEQAINQSVHPEVRQRAIAIRLLHLGQKPEAVAQVVMVSANTIWTWHRRYRQGGLNALQDRPRSGRPSKADGEYVTRLEQLLETDPHTLGLPFTIWTINRLRLYLAEQTHAFLTHPLKTKRRRARFEGAAAHDRRPLARNMARRGPQLFGRFDGTRAGHHDDLVPPYDDIAHLDLSVVSLGHINFQRDFVQRCNDHCDAASGQNFTGFQVECGDRASDGARNSALLQL